MAIVEDPVEQGFVTSLARPGGNLTGLSFQDSELVTETTGIAEGGYSWGHPRGRALGPNRSGADRIEGDRAGGSSDGTHPASPRGARGAGSRAGVSSRQATAGPSGHPTGVTALCRSQEDDPAPHGRESAPGSVPERSFVVDGCLMAYGPSFTDMFRRAAYYVERDSQGRHARRLARGAADEVQHGHQPQDREGPRPDDPAVAPAAGGSGDRVVERRAFIGTLAGGLLAAPLAAEAQPARVPRLCVLAADSRSSRARYRRVRSGSARLGLCGWANHHHRLPFRRRPARAVSRPRRRVCAPQAGHHRRIHHARQSGGEAGDQYNPRSHGADRGPCRYGNCGEPGTTRRKRHGADDHGHRAQQQAPSAAEGNGARGLSGRRTVTSHRPDRGGPSPRNGTRGQLDGPRPAEPSRPFPR